MFFSSLFRNNRKFWTFLISGITIGDNQFFPSCIPQRMLLQIPIFNFSDYLNHKKIVIYNYLLDWLAEIVRISDFFKKYIMRCIIEISTISLIVSPSCGRRNYSKLTELLRRNNWFYWIRLPHFSNTNSGFDFFQKWLIYCSCSNRISQPIEIQKNSALFWSRWTIFSCRFQCLMRKIYWNEKLLRQIC